MCLSSAPCWHANGTYMSLMESAIGLYRPVRGSACADVLAARDRRSARRYLYGQLVNPRQINTAKTRLC